VQKNHGALYGVGFSAGAVQTRFPNQLGDLIILNGNESEFTGFGQMVMCLVGGQIFKW